jgi:hypothetical protein
MNLYKLGFSSWIIGLNLILLITLFIVIISSDRDYFIDYPSQNTDASTANNNYASILLFIQNNPSKSIKFIEDIKQKFFNDSCTVKDTINFNKLAQLPNGMLF